MKQINSIASNIKDEVLGIITLKSKGFLGQDKYILVSEGLSTSKRGYAATISNTKLIGATNRLFCEVDNLTHFKDGDVVLINSSGTITFLYDIKSNHNAIMATELCNHRCVMCPQPPITQERDRTDFNLQLLSLFDKSTQEVGITGGEPTLIGEKLFVLFKYIQKHLPHSAISLLSNGVKFADKEYSKRLAMLCHHNLQIDIPLFSDIADIHNHIVGAKTFYKTVEGLYNLALFRQRIGIRVVVHRLNYKRLPQLAEYIYHNFPFVCQVAFMQMETFGLAEENIDKLWIDPYNYNAELEQAVLLLADRGINTYIYNAQLCILPKSIQSFAQQSISNWKNIYIDECVECELKENCAGFFASSVERHSDYIKKIVNISK